MRISDWSSDVCSSDLMVSTLDHVSEGRLIFGVGYGYNEDEFRNHGVDVSKRRDIVREKMLAMEALWSQETASFHGEHVSFTESWLYPKPYKRKRPPVLVGGQLIPKRSEEHTSELQSLMRISYAV